MHKIVASSYYLTKDGELRKSPKWEFARGLKNLLEEPRPTNVLETSLKTAILTGFVAYAQKVPIKKMNLVCYEDLFGALWKTFPSLSKGCTRMDIGFGLYLQQSIKQGERNRRSKLELIKTNISNIQQQLPVDMGRFHHPITRWISTSFHQVADVKWPIRCTSLPRRCECGRYRLLYTSMAWRNNKSTFP